MMKNVNIGHKHKSRLIIIFFIVIIVFSFGISRGVNVWYSYRLEQAIWDDNIFAVREIIERCPSCVNYYPGFLPISVYSVFEFSTTYPLIVAVKEDNVDIIKLLLESGADVNCNDGGTPLSIAYSLKPDHWYQVSCYLIENGADLNYIGMLDHGTTPVLEDIISRCNHNDNIGEVNAAFNYAFDHCDHTRVYWPRVLSYAVSYRRFEITEILLSAGVCDVNETFGDTTALMAATGKTKASSVYDPALVKLLLDYGADPTIEDENGYTAYDYAVMNDFTEVIEILSER